MKKAFLYTGIRVPGMEQDEDMEMLDDEAIGEKNGFFKVYHFGVLNALSDAELEEFGALRTDAERLAWVHARDYVHQMPSRMAEIMLANSFVKGKSADAAHGKRLDGNRAFQARDYVSAVDLYSEAVLKAPFVHQGMNVHQGLTCVPNCADSPRDPREILPRQ